MENIPSYVSFIFIVIVSATVFFLYKAARQSKIILLALLSWLILQSVIAATAFYLDTQSMPPRFLLLALPPLLSIAVIFCSAKGRQWMDRLNTTWLNWLHIVRIPVEIVLLLLFLYKQVPQLMTFEGRNFDIFSGITAPAIAYFGYAKKQLSKTVLLGWNLICLALLLNIVVNAILSAPFPFQQFAFDQPNMAILYFPFVLLPGFIVPAVLFAHLVSIRHLLVKN